MEFNKLLETIQKDHPNLRFRVSDHFSWSSTKSQINYKVPEINDHENHHSNKLLHELAHAELKHSSYKSDAKLLKIESEAWELTKKLCSKYNIDFNKKEQDESLGSYINWASSRSKCPKCKKNGLQIMQTEFLCPSCSHKWNVGRSRFTRTYRQNS